MIGTRSIIHHFSDFIEISYNENINFIMTYVTDIDWKINENKELLNNCALFLICYLSTENMYDQI